MAKQQFPNIEIEKQKTEKAEADKTIKQCINNLKINWLLARNSMVAFAVAALIGIGAGSATYAYGYLVTPSKDKYPSYIDAFKHAYDVLDLTKDTVIAMLLLVGAALLANCCLREERRNAKRAVKEILLEHNAGAENHTPSRLAYIYGESGLDLNNPTGKLNPICYEIIKEVSSRNPELFDALAVGDVRGPTDSYAMAVIEGYLKTHPDDFQKVLDSFESVPQSLICKYAGRTR